MNVWLRQKRNSLGEFFKNWNEFAEMEDRK